MQDPRIIHWRQGDPEQNFGDFLTELMVQEIFLFPRVEGDLYRIVGSCIAEWMIWDDLLKLGRQDNGRIVYWGCGLRDETPIHPDVVARCRFHGVRGPLSRDVLGLPQNTPLMDPGLLAPLIHKPRPSPATAGMILCMPHVADPKTDSELLALSGAQAVVRPTVNNDVEDLRKLLDTIAGAKFLLTGSLHGAIFACAYDVPFAFWDTGHLDISFKWRDFAGSVGIPSIFARNVIDGRKAYDELIAPVIRRPPTFPLLSESPIEVRPSVLLRSLIMDGVAPPKGFAGLVRTLSSSKIERVSVRKAQVRDNIAFRRQLDEERLIRTRALLDEVERLAAEATALNQTLAGVTEQTEKLEAEKAALLARIAEDRSAFELELSASIETITSIGAKNEKLLAKLSTAERALELAQERFSHAEATSAALAASSKDEHEVLQRSIGLLQAELDAVDKAIRSAPWPIAPPTDKAPLASRIEKLSTSLNGHLKVQSDARQLDLANASRQARTVHETQAERNGLISKVMQLEDEILLVRTRLSAVLLENGRLAQELEARRQVARA